MKIIRNKNQNIFAMATNRKLAKGRIISLADELCSNIVKISVYPKSVDCQHWIDEIANWVDAINKITLKPNNAKFNYNEYTEMIFEYFGDSRLDLYALLSEWIIKNCRHGKKYPEFEVTEDLIDRLFLNLNKLKDYVCRLCSSKNNVNRSEILNNLNEILGD